MNQPRLIRKYVNRRLYDTAQSRYVNLDDLRRLIADGYEMRVVDQANGEDITVAVLLQLLGEAQREGSQMLQAPFLTDLIRLTARANAPDLPDQLNAALRAALATVITPAAPPSRDVQSISETAAG
jgi:polyhydroxyalkanoate synthesis repressor PhaR